MECKVPTKWMQDGFALGNWVSNRREEITTRSSPAMRDELTPIGFVWKVSKS